MSGRGIKFYARRPKTLEEKLTDNLTEIEANPNAEVLPITEGYLAALESDEALANFLEKQAQKVKLGKPKN